jgi:hypothetical protein
MKKKFRKESKIMPAICPYCGKNLSRLRLEEQREEIRQAIDMAAKREREQEEPDAMILENAKRCSRWKGIADDKVLKSNTLKILNLFGEDDPRDMYYVIAFLLEYCAVLENDIIEMNKNEAEREEEASQS